MTVPDLFKKLGLSALWYVSPLPPESDMVLSVERLDIINQPGLQVHDELFTRQYLRAELQAVPVGLLFSQQWLVGDQNVSTPAVQLGLRRAKEFMRAIIESFHGQYVAATGEYERVGRELLSGHLRGVLVRVETITRPDNMRPQTTWHPITQDENGVRMRAAELNMIDALEANDEATYKQWRDIFADLGGGLADACKITIPPAGSP